MGMTGIDKSGSLLVAGRTYPLNSKIRAAKNSQLSDAEEAMYAQYGANLLYATV